MSFTEYEFEQVGRLGQEDQETSVDHTRILMRAGIAKHLIDYNDRHHQTHRTPKVNPETARFGVVKDGEYSEVRGWWTPIPPESALAYNQTYHQRLDWRWTLSGNAAAGYFTGYPESDNQLTPEQSAVIDSIIQSA